jgi:hypothetical protein
MGNESAAVGDEIPPGCEIIEVRVAELRQLFNAIDPSPFYDRDLDPNAEEFITNWASGVPASTSLGLRVHIDRPAGAAGDADMLRDAVQQHFRRKSAASLRRLRALFERGRTSLVIGLAFLGGSSWVASALKGVTGGGFGDLLRQSLIIGGWVAMWRPMEVFLYDWWPIRAEARRYDRLALMPVRIQYAPEGTPPGGRREGPAISAGAPPARHGTT